MPISPKALSIFDLDKTLAKKNTSFAFGAWCYRNKMLSTFSMISMVIDFALHRLDLISFLTVHRRAKKRFTHATSQNAKKFVDEEWKNLIHSPIYTCLEKAQQDNHHILLLSAGPSILVQEIVKKLPELTWHATLWDDNGKITVLDGEKKLEIAKQYATDLNVTKEGITVYTDSIHDLPLLQFAGNPVVTQPDRKLKKLCQLNNWPVL